ncbi:MAG: TRASH domain-containing protein [Planctomycetaceae bacterium]
MTRLIIASFVATTFLGGPSSGPATAHEGHQNGPGKTKPKKQAPKLGGFDRRFAPGDRFRGPARNRRRGHSHGGGYSRDGGETGHRHGVGRKPRDLRTTTVRLEFAAEIIGDEISFEIPRSRFREHVLKLAADVEKQTRHFRGEVERGADVDHVRKDFGAVTASFSTLVRSMRHAPEAFLTHRAMARAGRLMDDVSRQLKATPSPAGARSPAAAPRLPIPGQGPQPIPKPIVIPENMKGIALLPRADQAPALAQKTCPVTGDLLGSDGKPLTVQVRGRTVYVCCDGCVDELKENPAKFLKIRP